MCVCTMFVYTIRKRLCTFAIVLITHPRCIRGLRPRKKVSPCGIKCILTLFHGGEGVWVPLDCQARVETLFKPFSANCTCVCAHVHLSCNVRFCASRVLREYVARAHTVCAVDTPYLLASLITKTALASSSTYGSTAPHPAAQRTRAKVSYLSFLLLVLLLASLLRGATPFVDALGAAPVTARKQLRPLAAAPHRAAADGATLAIRVLLCDFSHTHAHWSYTRYVHIGR